MTEVGIRALKQNASAVVAQVAAGERVTITDRGRPVAQLTPIPSSRVEQLIEAGHARRARHDVAALPAPRPGPVVAEGETPALLTWLRAADRDPSLLRSLDAVHLAAALALGDDLEGLVTYDGRMASAAELHGLPVTAPA